jgi:glycosyltransferase involved in cell wall biosynthesis
VVPFGAVRILLDYRPALRERTGVGEYAHELARALARTATGDEISVLSTSWKDRPSASVAEHLAGVRIVDRRVPVRPLTWTWNRLGWPPVEWLAGQTDVVHAQSPLLIPATKAAQVVTIHDLDFMRHPERAEAEMRRDFPRLVSDHARRADHVIVSSHYAAREVIAKFDLLPNKVSVCSPGAPDWAHAIARERAATPGSPGTVILFMGTLEPRKNIGALLDAYARLRGRSADAPPLVLAGRAKAAVERELERVRTAPLTGNVSLRGYVSQQERQRLYREARMLVLPSLEEGFGLPVLEAMACGVPVVVSNRGSLPEVVGDAASPVDPDDVQGMALEMERVLDPDVARSAVSRGLAQAARYSWDACAASAREAYRAAVAARDRRGP